MFNAVIPTFEDQDFDVEDDLYECFIDKYCEICGEDCEWEKEDIKQYFRCCHYNCPLLFSYMHHCINCGCDRRRIKKKM